MKGYPPKPSQFHLTPLPSMSHKTMKSSFLILASTILLIAGTSGSAHAQAGTTGGAAGTPGASGLEEGIRGFWECITPTGKFVVRLDQIASVSQHEYLIDGGARVYEVTVATTGPQIARYYFIEPITEGSPLSLGKATIDRLRDVAGEAGGRAGMDTERDVIKSYPNTTHAKTSEYRLRVKDNLDRIYRHIHRVWAEEKGRGNQNKITIRDE